MRKLEAREISCRVQQISEKGLTLLLYITSRAGQNILDEIYGPLGWKREHTLIDGNLFCTISVWNNEIGQWISKQDVGTESSTEKEKGEASDSFKRACVNFGIGRELYSAPYIYITSKQVEIKSRENNGRTQYYTYDKFEIKKITYKDDEIDSLVIVNQKLEIVYEKWPSKTIDSIKLGLIRDQLERTGVSEKEICDFASVKYIEDITEELFIKVYNKLLISHSKDGEKTCTQ